MKILSIYPWTHISSSALMIDGKLVCGSAEEIRLNGRQIFQLNLQNGV